MARSPLVPRQPAVPAPNADTQALFDEINQEVKAKALNNFFKRYGAAIIGALVAVVLGTAIASTMANMKTRAREADSEKLIGLIDKSTDGMAAEDLQARVGEYDALARNASGDGQRMLAAFAAAGTLMHNGKMEEGLAKLKTIEADGTLRPLYRDYAKLMNIRARMDKGDAAALQQEIAPLLDPKNAWYLSALETSAILFARQGKMEDAVNQLKGITDTEDAPVAVRERAVQLTRLYSAK